MKKDTSEKSDCLRTQVQKHEDRNTLTIEYQKSRQTDTQTNRQTQRQRKNIKDSFKKKHSRRPTGVDYYNKKSRQTDRQRLKVKGSDRTENITQRPIFALCIF